MARKSAQEAAKKKAAKQKKKLIVLGFVLVLALGYAVMTISSLNSSHPVSAVPAAATTPAGSASTITTAPAVTPGIAAPPAGSLRTFRGLGRKDPFHDSGPDFTTVPSSSPKSKPATGQVRSAVISIDGKRVAVAVGTKFGHSPGSSAAPLFRLVKASATTAVVAVIGTQQQFTLHVRQPLTLAQSSLWKHTLTLEPFGSAASLKSERASTRH